MLTMKRLLLVSTLLAMPAAAIAQPSPPAGCGTIINANAWVCNPNPLAGAAALPTDVIQMARPSLGTQASASIPGTVAQVLNALTAAQVVAALGYTPGSSGIASFNTRTGAITLLEADVIAALGFTPVNPAGLASTGIATPVGSTARTIAARFTDVANVADCAVADGATDNTACFQNAITVYAGKSVVLIPKAAGQYVTAGLAIPSNAQIQIDGYVLLKAGANASMLTINSGASNIVIRGAGTLDGNQTNQTSGTIGGIVTPNTPASNIWINGGLTITNVQNWPINLVTVTGAWLSNLILSNSGNSPEFANGTNNCWADHLKVTGIHDEAFAFYGGVYNCGISNSLFYTNSFTGIAVLNDASQVQPNHDIVILGNEVTGSGGDGIGVYTNGGLTNYNHDISIVGNDVHGNSTANNGAAEITINSTHILVAANRLHGSGVGATAASGIVLSTASSYVSLLSNTIYDEGIGSTLGVGIQDNSAPYLIASGNVIFDDQATKTMAFAMNGTAGVGSQFLANTLQTFLGAPDHITAVSDTVKAESPAPGSPFSVTGGLSATTGDVAAAVGRVLAYGTQNGVLLKGGDGAGASPIIETFGADINVALTMAFQGLAGLNITGSCNNLGLSGAPTGTAVGLVAFGCDPNIGISFVTKGNLPVGITGAGGLNITTGPLQVGTGFVTPSLVGTSASIGGSAVIAGECTFATAGVSGATTGMVAAASPVTYPGDGFVWGAYVSAPNVVTVKLCAIAAGTPTASAYNVRVIQ